MVTLEEAKAHVRVRHDDEDGRIEAMIDAAGDHLSSIGVDLTAAPLPPAVRHAILLLVAHFFDHADAPDAPAVPAAVDRLVAPYREVAL